MYKFETIDADTVASELLSDATTLEAFRNLLFPKHENIFWQRAAFVLLVVALKQNKNSTLAEVLQLLLKISPATFVSSLGDEAKAQYNECFGSLNNKTLASIHLTLVMTLQEFVVTNSSVLNAVFVE